VRGVGTASGTRDGLLLSFFGLRSSKFLVNPSVGSSLTLGICHNASFLHSNSSLEGSHAPVGSLTSCSTESGSASSVGKPGLSFKLDQVSSFHEFHLSSEFLDLLEILSVQLFLLLDNFFVCSSENFIGLELGNKLNMLLVAVLESLTQFSDIKS
jgi:hypothetical protein